MKDGTYIVRVGDDGFPTLGEPLAMANGYWVSTEGIAVHGKLDHRAISDSLQLMEVHEGSVIGIWESEGITYIDRSTYIKDRSQALAVAEACNQMAIYDCSKGEAIDL